MSLFSRRDSEHGRFRAGETGLLTCGAFAPYERLAAGKTSAQGKFTSPEHLNQRVGGRLRRLKPKKKDTLNACLSFWCG